MAYDTKQGGHEVAQANRPDYRLEVGRAEIPIGEARGFSESSVVDGSNLAHDVPNLFVVDGSSLPTSAAVNPTATILALALRCADHIWDRRRDWS